MKSIAVLGVIGILAGCSAPIDDTTTPTISVKPSITKPSPTIKPSPIKYKGVIIFHLSRYPNISDHIRDAQASGESKVCTIDREGADDRRRDALEGHPTSKGKDRDEYPPALCEEGGVGADIRLVPSKENRSAGAWMGNRLEKYPNGTVILFKVAK